MPGRWQSEEPEAFKPLIFTAEETNYSMLTIAANDGDPERARAVFAHEGLPMPVDDVVERWCASERYEEVCERYAGWL